MNNPLVSVVIDNYNYAEYLAKSIDSVLEQTYKNIELIVVDDGSKDNSQEIISSYADKLIPVFQKNAGQLSAINTGFSKATGEYICFLDSDDYFHPEKVEKVVEAFQSKPDWIQISHPWVSINGDGNIRGSSTSNKMSRGDVSKLLLKVGRYASGITSSLAYRRSALEKIFPIPLIEGKNTYTGYIDSYLNTTVPFYGKVGCVNQPLMFYRIHNNNGHAHSNNLEKRIQERQLYAEFINEAAQKTGCSERFDVQRDPDFLSYKIVKNQRSSLQEKISVVTLSVYESFLIRRSIRDTLIRLFFRGYCALFPKQGSSLLELGIRDFLSRKKI